MTGIRSRFYPYLKITENFTKVLEIGYLKWHKTGFEWVLIILCSVSDADDNVEEEEKEFCTTMMVLIVGNPMVFCWNWS